ncbi:hypothetical protein ACLKA6_000887 [Drosophila palustris]
MQNMTLQQVHELRKAQEDLNFTKSIYLEFYRKMAKHAFTTELNNLIRGDFNRVDVELHIPKLPPQITQEAYTPMLQVDKMVELYDAVNKSLL